MAANPGPTLGALMVGGLVSCVVYGVTCSQTVVYFQRNQNDRLLLKLLVFSLWLLDTADVLLNGHALYWYFVLNYMNPVTFLSPVWSIVLHVALTSITDFLVRGMFVRRVWRMSRGNKPLTVFLAAISLMDLVCGITITIKAYHVTFAGLNNLRVLLYLNFASGFSGDACVALSLCYYLYTSRTGFGKTDTLIYVLILYTVNTGLITALDASLGLITYVAMPKSFVFVSFYFLLSKLYVNAFLASLNARGSLRVRTEDVVSINLSRMSQSRMNFADPTLTAGSQQPTVGKHVDTPQVSVSQVDMEEYKQTYSADLV